MPIRPHRPLAKFAMLLDPLLDVLLDVLPDPLLNALPDPLRQKGHRP